MDLKEKRNLPGTMWRSKVKDEIERETPGHLVNLAAILLLGGQATRLLGDQATRLLGDQATRLLGDQATRLLGDQATKQSVSQKKKPQARM